MARARSGGNAVCSTVAHGPRAHNRVVLGLDADSNRSKLTHTDHAADRVRPLPCYEETGGPFKDLKPAKPELERSLL